MNFTVKKFYNSKDYANLQATQSVALSAPTSNPSIVNGEIVKPVPEKIENLNRVAIGFVVVAGIGLVVASIIAYRAHQKIKKAKNSEGVARQKEALANAQSEQLMQALIRERKNTQAFLEKQKCNHRNLSRYRKAA